MINKKGQGLSVETIILIVIGVLVLVFLIIGFSMGWSKIFPFINPPNNVKDISDKCGYACQTDDKYNYCTALKEVTVDTEIVAKDASGKDVAFGKKISGSCFELNAIATLGMPACLNVACETANAPYVFRNKAFADVACVQKREAGLAGATKLLYKMPAGATDGELDCAPKVATTA